MYEIILFTFILLVLYFDLKSRIIPDELNFFFMFLAIALIIFQFEFDIHLLLATYAPFFLFNFAFAYLLYKFGAWAGGDVKFFTAIMAYLPLYAGKFMAFSALSVFILSAILLIPIASLYYMRELVLYRRSFKKIFNDSIINAAKSATISFSALFLISIFTQNLQNPMVILIFLIISYFIKIPTKMALLLTFAGFLIMGSLIQNAAGTGPIGYDYPISLFILLFTVSFIIYFLRFSFNLLATKVLTKPVSIENLKEGDIPAATYYLEGKKLKIWTAKDALSQLRELIKIGNRINIKQGLIALKPNGKIIVDSLKARGVTIEEIKELKRLDVKELLIKQSLPFAPVIAAAFLLQGYFDILAFFGFG